MKIRPEHFAHMREAIRAAQAKQPTFTAAYYRSFGATAKRHRWDLCHAAGLTPWICKNIYPYANDDHIDTALKAILREMEADARDKVQ